MEKKPLSTPQAPAAIGPYSQAVLVGLGGGKLLYTSGQIAMDPVTGTLVGQDARSQTVRVMQNLEAVLAAAGATFADVVKTTIFLTDMADYAAVNEVYADSFTHDPPARSAVGVAALPKGARIEMEMVAVVP